MAAEIEIARVQAAVGDRWRLVYRREVDSTMTMARELAECGAPAGTVALADAQRAGRGRLGRSWVSEPGVNLYFTVVLRPALDVLRQLAMLTPLAVAEGIERAAGVNTEVKWPNDVQIGGRKVSGVLIDAEVRGSEPALALVGIGINVNFDSSAVPELREVATSIRAVLGRPVPREAVLAAVLGRMAALLDRCSSGGSVRDAWRARLNTLGREIALRAGERIVRGRAVDVSEDGGLVLQLADGMREVFAAGEVTLSV
ncbi:MAG TPA: biotin--[acetyl-CoA-carboxylase] ligase [Dehalococcoidia bacterium]|nr:biotin--[acetyl-CoA-carboxylase] ligase [Dehalococcoidia bacterium]